MSADHPYFDAPFAALAHRGFSLEGLENSMKAFQAAVDLGYRYVETDAHGTLDGVAVALHDSSLDRTTDAFGEVADLPWEMVKEAKIGGVEPVPLLEDLLGTWPDLRVNIDVKGESGIVPVAEAIERTASHDRVCVASFSAARRDATVRLLTRPVATSAGQGEAARFIIGAALGLGSLRGTARVDALQIPWRVGVVPVLGSRHLRLAHSLDVKVHVWTVNTASEMEALIDAGVDGIVSDRADILKDVLVARGAW